MLSKEILHKDINHIISSLEIEQRDLQEETKDHILCLINDRIEMDGFTNHKEVLQSSRYEILDLASNAKRTMEDHKKTDLFHMMLNSVRGDSIFVWLSFAAIIFVIYFNAGFWGAPDIEGAAFISLVAYLFVRIRIRKRKKAHRSYANKIIRRYAIIPFIINLAFIFFLLFISKSMFRTLGNWNLDFLHSIPISIASIGGGIFLKVIIDSIYNIPKMINSQTQLDRALSDIGYA